MGPREQLDGLAHEFPVFHKHLIGSPNHDTGLPTDPTDDDPLSWTSESL